MAKCPYDPEKAADQIQAHLLRASKFEDGATRNWSLFFFFRILPQAEADESVQRLKAFAEAVAGGGDVSKVLMDLQHPSLLYAGLAKQRAAEAKQRASAAKQAAAKAQAAAQSPTDPPTPAAEQPAPDGPAQAFLDWLTVIVAGDKSKMLASARLTLAPAVAAGRAEHPGLLSGLRDHLRAPHLEALERWTREMPDAEKVSLRSLLALLRKALRVLQSPAEYRSLLKAFGGSYDRAGERALSGGLPMVAFYEVLRQGAQAFAHDNGPEESAEQASAVRSEAWEARRHQKLRQRGPGNSHDKPDLGDSYRVGTYDQTPITLAFSFAGLQALQLDQATLSTFPDAFQQGMAARAARLQDTGPSAPETWEGELGLPSVHGFFTGGFALPDEVEERLWRDLRADVAAFNMATGKRGQFLRMWLGLAFRFLGLEVLHIELGQDPYTVEAGEDGVKRTKALPRNEHFGFRDGVSQPFVDMSLGDPPPGGGTPGPDGTWSPIAPGEIFLDMPDEDGVISETPISEDLRSGATFLVFRKLEQNVAEFRQFLAQQRPKDPEAQVQLAAQFVGRWPNGAPLVLSPDFSANGEGGLNDFRYDADDPGGAKCPLGAHIRRTNPRDTGGRAALVSRHRILRRGISYGGPRLPDDQPLGDGLRRGLLFIAANSRIDLQFEVIQADWINQGELVGQVGLRRCPLTGANGGTALDSFLERGAATPVTGIPRFVVNRGGDYYFAPGIGALKAIARGERFASDDVPFAGYSMNDAVTPTLFNLGRLDQLGETILGQTGPTSVNVTTPSNETFAVIGRYADVAQALSQRTQAGGPCAFSVLSYHRSSLNFTRGRIVLGATDSSPPVDPRRQRLLGVLNEAWNTLHQNIDTGQAIARIARDCLDQTLRRVATSGRVDLTADLSGQVAYALAEEFFGTPGPTWLTELATAIQFSKQHIGELPSDWIAQLQAAPPTNPGRVSMQLWSILIAADLLANLESRQEISAFARQAGSEMLTQLDTLLQQARGRRMERPGLKTRTLLDAFVENQDHAIVLSYYGSKDGKLTDDGAFEYYGDAALILLELVGTALAGIPAAAAKVFTTMFEHRIDLPGLMRTLHAIDPCDPSAVRQLIYEAERLNPTMPILMRRGETDTLLSSGAPVRGGDWVASVVQMANLDHRVFPEPNRLSLAPYFQGPARCPTSYLMFGVMGSEKECWGHKQGIPQAVLVEIMYAAARLQGLRRVAGPAGEPPTLLGAVPIGFPARFTTLDPPLR